MTIFVTHHPTTPICVSLRVDMNGQLPPLHPGKREQIGAQRTTGHLARPLQLNQHGGQPDPGLAAVANTSRNPGPVPIGV